MIYYVILLILAFFSYVHILEEDKTKLVGLYFATIILFLVFGGMRYEVGADWFSYEKILRGLYNWDNVFNSREERLFLAYLYVMKSFSDNYSLIVFVIFAISFLMKVYIIDKYSSNLFFSLVIYFAAVFMIYDINAIRQGMAIGVVLLSIPSILERKLLPFVIIVTIASFIHTSAIIFFPFYLVSGINISVKWIMIIVVIVLLVSIPIREFMLANPLFTTLISSDSLKHYGSYLEEKEANKSVEIISIAVFQRVVFLSIVLYNYKKIDLPENQKRLFLNGYFISFLIFILFSFSTEFAARLSFYYKAFEMIIIPHVVTAQKSHVAKLIYFAIFLILTAIAASRLLSVQDSGLLPYQLYWFK